MPRLIPRILPIIAAICLLSDQATSAERIGLGISPQIMVGTAGVETGVAVEYRFDEGRSDFSLRPEIFLSNDGDLGGGASALWRASSMIEFIPAWQSLCVGPRVVYHNGDEFGIEASAMAKWSVDLDETNRWRHAVSAIGAVGVVDDTEADKTAFAFSIGLAYTFGF